ncbi:family 20 glycosylhydrolase [Nostoc ellipsosporum NOK]|nr:family 20 glycosylhydrolase [Nostoc ellipsosporum NOK]
MRKLLLLFLIVFSFQLCGQTQAIIPEPVAISAGKGQFKLSRQTVIVSNDPAIRDAIIFFNQYLFENYGFRLTVKKQHTGSSIRLISRVFIRAPDKNAYQLTVDKKSITIEGDTHAGTFYGLQTLIQLLPVEKSTSLTIPALSINDYPRFKYRGMMLDVSRHFFSVEMVKKYIDYLALHKINYFHWHLTDDQGWRIEIKKYPLLTQKGAWRNGTITGRYPGNGNTNQQYGGYYTQAQIKEVVAYAAARYITVVPEIEMPGHGSAAIAAYPELSCFPQRSTYSYYPKECAWSGDTTGKHVQQTWGVFDDVFCAGKENTFRFLQGVIDEVIPLFPGPYIHVGGDECPKENWKACPDCQRRIRENGLKDEHELQSYLIQRMEKYINAKGRKLIGWDEILEGGLAPNATVMSWRGEKGGIEAAAQKHTVIMTPTSYVYFDYAQSRREDSVTNGGVNELEKVYSYNPIPAEMPAADTSFVLGAQANMWTEYIGNRRKLEYMLFPRLAALSEVLWTPVEKKSMQNFERKLRTQLRRYDRWKANYSRAFYQIKQKITQAPGHGLYWELSSRSGKPITFVTDLIDSSGYYKQPVLINQRSTFTAYCGGQSISQTFFFNKATARHISLSPAPSKSYPGEGAFTLVNGIRTDRKLQEPDYWIGYQGKAFTITIDLGKDDTFSEIKLATLQQPNSWIYAPLRIVLSVSDDNSTYRAIEGLTFSLKENELTARLPQAVKARYLRIHVPEGQLIPAGAPGAGSKAWVFLQEVEVN